MDVLDIGQLLLSLLVFSSTTLLIWSLFRFPAVAEPPINRQIAIALGLASRPSAFETPVIGQLLGLCVLIARRFPFYRHRIRQDLEASGNPNGYSVDEYLGICLAAAIGSGLVSLLLVGNIGSFDFVLVIAMPLLGFFVIVWALNEQAVKRTRAIAKKLPYTLDLIALLMEAGASFTEAVETLVRDEPEDELCHELRLVQAEIDFGTPRSAALANMADRIPLESLRSVVGAINQAEALGTPLSTILKSQSGMIRTMRSVRAEEASASASLRILKPGVLILAATVMVVFSPFIMRWMEGQLFTP